MIRYALVCEAGHEFDGWFASGDAYEKQARQGHVLCSRCGSAKVSKGVMAPNIATESSHKPGSQSISDAESDPAPAREEAVAMVRKFREHVEKTSVNVGDRFADEARKIHYKEAEPRGIIGSVTQSEAKELSEEGVEFLPLPGLPEDHN